MVHLEPLCSCFKIILHQKVKGRGEERIKEVENMVACQSLTML